MSDMQIQQMMDEVYMTSCQSPGQIEIVDDFREKTAGIEQMFSDMEEIWTNREIYSLHWAFQHASLNFNHALTAMEEYAKNPFYTDPRLLNLAKATWDDTRKAASQFRHLSQVTMALDMIVSVIMILGVTFLAQSIESMLQSYTLIVLFIGIIALGKVSLDRFMIIPNINDWGWKRYHSLTHDIEWNLARYIAMKLDIILTNMDITGDYINRKHGIYTKAHLES